MAEGPFGVELPENLGAPSPGGNTPEPEGSPAGDSPGGETSSNEGQKPQTPGELLDLDKHERFRFAGREWTRKELQSAYLMREDYSKKTNEVAEARKYADNFAADLRTLSRDPSRLEDFKRLYPQEYVALAEQYLQNGKAPTQGNSQPTNPNANPQNPKLDELYEKVSKWEASQKEAELASIQSWLDNQFSTLGKKYPFADAEVVNARAEVASRQGTKITDQVLDKLFKASNTETEKRWAEHYKTKVTKQVETGRRGRDMGPGGGTPTGEPQRPKNIREATKFALEDLASRG